MRRNIFIGVLLLIAIVILIALYPRYKTLKEKMPIGQQASVVTTTLQTIKESNPTERYTIDIEYPAVSGLQDVRKQEDINQKLQKIAISTKDAFLEETQTNNKNAYTEQFENSLLIRYIVSRADNTWVSIEYIISDFQAGAAHPNTFTTTVNYNIPYGQLIGITNIFKKDSDYLQTLSQLASVDLAEQDKKGGNDFSSFIATGASANAENFKQFLLTTNSMVLIFDPALVSPYSAGIRKVIIPFEKLQTVLNSELSF